MRPRCPFKALANEWLALAGSDHFSQVHSHGLKASKERLGKSVRRQIAELSAASHQLPGPGRATSHKASIIISQDGDSGHHHSQLP